MFPAGLASMPPPAATRPTAFPLRTATGDVPEIAFKDTLFQPVSAMQIHGIGATHTTSIAPATMTGAVFHPDQASSRIRSMRRSGSAAPHSN